MNIWDIEESGISDECAELIWIDINVDSWDSEWLNVWNIWDECAEEVIWENCWRYSLWRLIWWFLLQHWHMCGTLCFSLDMLLWFRWYSTLLVRIWLAKICKDHPGMCQLNTDVVFCRPQDINRLDLATREDPWTHGPRRFHRFTLFGDSKTSQENFNPWECA